MWCLNSKLKQVLPEQDFEANTVACAITTVDIGSDEVNYSDSVKKGKI